MAPTSKDSRPKNVVVSGAARGVGRALARHLLESGHCVYMMDIDQQELEYAAKTHLKPFYDSNQLAFAVCDVSNVLDIRSKVQEAAHFFHGRIHVLINNGGIASPYWKDGKTMEDKDTLEQWQAYVDTNLTGPFAMSQACIPYMKETPDAVADAQKHRGAGPCIIHIGSFRAHQSDPNQEGYAASKAGQLGLMQAMSISLGPMGIRVNLVAPGRIKVAHECQQGDEQGESWEGQMSDKDIGDHPANRAGRPKDIADACLYLIDAGFVTGQDITVDGGALRKKA